MDFPKGLIVKENLYLDDLLSGIKTLDKNFTGYITFDVDGYGGIEEGILVLNGSKVVLAEYIHYRFGKNLAGNNALPYIFNLLALKKGVLNVVSLDVREMEYTLEMNEAYRLSKPFDIHKLEKLVKPQYDVEMVKKLEEEMIQVAMQNREIIKISALSKIIFEAKDKSVLLHRYRINIDRIRSEAEKIAMAIKGEAGGPEDIIKSKLAEELEKLDAVKLESIVCRVFEKEKVLKIKIKMTVFESKLKEPINNIETLKQVIESLAKAIVAEETPQYKDLNIQIEYNIERVK